MEFETCVRYTVICYWWIFSPGITLMKKNTACKSVQLSRKNTELYFSHNSCHVTLWKIMPVNRIKWCVCLGANAFCRENGRKLIEHYRIYFNRQMDAFYTFGKRWCTGRWNRVENLVEMHEKKIKCIKLGFPSVFITALIVY